MSSLMRYTLVLQAPFSVLQFVIPTGRRPTTTVLAPTADANVYAGANQNTNYGMSMGLSVSLSSTTNHDSTSVALMQYSLRPLKAGTVRSAPR